MVKMSNKRAWVIVISITIGIVLLVGGLFWIYQTKSMQVQEKVLITLYDFIEEAAEKNEVEISNFHLEKDTFNGIQKLVISGIGTDYAKTAELVSIIDHQQAFEVEWVAQIDQIDNEEGDGFLFPFSVSFSPNKEVINYFNRKNIQNLGVEKTQEE